MSTDLGEPAATTATQQQDGHPVWRHALEIGPIITGVVFLAGAVSHMLRMPLLAVIVIASAIAGSVTAAGQIMARSAAVAWWITVTACCAAGWTAYAAVAGPWSWAAWSGLAVPAVILIPLWAAARHHEDKTAAAERRRLAALAAAQDDRKWPELLARIGHKGVTFTGRTDTKCGYDVRLRLPAHGRVTFKALHAATDKLEIAARVRRGSLRFEQLPGDGAHEVILHVAERDFLAETIRMPLPARRRSINDPIPVGVYEDGTEATLTLREVATLIVGLRGKGKSNLLNVLIAHLACCVDVVIFCIDLKHRLVRPWIQPWLDKQAYRPVIDWAATTPEETDLLLEACLRGIAARAGSGDGREKVVPSKDEPAVITIIDEMAVIFGQNTGGNAYGAGPTNFQLATKAKRMTILGRSEAIDPVYASQRGTVTMAGDGDLKSQCDLRIGLGVATQEDARLVIPDDVQVAADLAKLVHPGCGILQRKNGRATPFKVYRCEPEDIAQIAIMTGSFRPAPDKRLRDAFGHVYEERWQVRGQYLVATAAPAAGVLAPPGAEPDEFQRIVSANLADLDTLGPQMPADDASPARQRMRDYLRKMSPSAVMPKAIVTLLESERMPVTRQTVQRWLAEDAAAGLIEPAGKFGQWRWRGGL